VETEYLLNHLREQLAARAGELAVEVALVEGCIHLLGTVTSAPRRAELEEIAKSMSDGRAVVNEILIVPVEPAQQTPEQVA
jgi:hypothetical protein